MRLISVILVLASASAVLAHQIKVEDVKIVFESRSKNRNEARKIQPPPPPPENGPQPQPGPEDTNSSCAPGCYRCYSYNKCYDCYPGFYLSEGYCYKQPDASAQGSGSWLFWLFTIICICCCCMCCGGIIRAAVDEAIMNAHRNEEGYHAANSPHHHDNAREMTNMNDSHGNPMMGGAHIHDGNPPAHHLQGQHYMPPPPLDISQNPYSGANQRNIANPAGYGLQPLNNYTTPNSGSDYYYSHEHGTANTPLPPGFAANSPVYPNTPLPLAPVLERKIKDMDYPTLIDKSLKNDEESKKQSQSALDSSKDDPLKNDQKTDGREPGVAKS